MNGVQPWPEPKVFSAGIFTALSEGEWRSSEDISPPRVYDRKSPIFHEGRSATHVYLVGGGLVKTYKKPSHDRVQIINLLSAGDVLGAEALTCSSYCESASALSRSLIFVCEKTKFLDFMSRKPMVSLALFRMLSEQFDRIQSLICDLGTKKALPRVASCILLVMDKQVPPGERRPFNLPISRQEMGAFLGLSPETVSRQLKDLATSKVIRLEHKRLTVLDLDHLKNIAQA